MITKGDYVNLKELATSLAYDLSNVPLDTSFSLETLISARNQLAIRKLKYESRKYESRIKAYIHRVQNGDSLFKISQEVNFSSYKFAKLFLENFSPDKYTVSDFLDNPIILEDERIRLDILECISNDPTCSLECTIIAETYGREYENILNENLSSLHISYETEHELRAKGRSKTPDVLLMMPMSISTPYRDQEFFVVNWIDSKAMFADEDTLMDNLQQFKSYQNRYGTGLVIYWFGFIDTLLEIVKKEDLGIQITDQFPTTWIYPTGEIASLECIPSFMSQPHHPSVALIKK